MRKNLREKADTQDEDWRDTRWSTKKEVNREIMVVSRAGKARSRKWGTVIIDLETGQTSWVNKSEYTNFRRMPEEEVLMEEFDDGKIM